MSSNVNNNTVGGMGSTSGGASGASAHFHQPMEPRESKTLNDKLKAFFKGFSKGNTVVAGAGGGLGIQGPGYHHSGSSSTYKMTPELSPTQTNVLLTPELLANLSSTQPAAVRLKALQVLKEQVRSRRIEPHTVEVLWTETCDLFASKEISERHMCFTAFTTIIQVQFEKPGFLRAKLFAFIRGHDKVEDTIPRFELLKALSQNGRDLTYFEEKMGPFLFNWMLSGSLYGGAGHDGLKVEDFMGLLVNVVKFNSSFIDDDVLGGFIQHTCITALTCIEPEDTLACINLLNNIVSYSMIPPNTLQAVVATLCRTVNVKHLCVASWKLMRNLLGTNLGHSGLFTLIQFMNTELPPQTSVSKESSNLNNTLPGSDATPSGGNEASGGSTTTTTTTSVEMDAVIRGAVFYTGIALWGGSNRFLRNLTRGSSAGGGGGGIVGVVLAAYEKTLARNNPLITYEVLLRVQDLIRNSADSLQVIGWDLVLEIMRKIIDYSKQQEYLANLASSEEQKQQLLRNNELLLGQIHETLNLIEAVLPTKTFCGSVQKYWEAVLEPVFYTRPIASIESLLKYKHIRLLDCSSTQFLPNLVQFSHLHFQKETRTSLRLQALELVKKICLLNQDCLEEHLLDNVILPNLKNVELEGEPAVRQHCVQFIVEFLMDSRSKKGHDLLHYVEKVVNRPFEACNQGQTVPSFQESEVEDIRTGVQGIIQIFQRKIYSLPSSIAVTAFKILVRHLEKHYKAKQNCLEHCASIRYQIFECFFRIRANALYHLGFPNEQGVVTCYSSYLAVDHKDPRESGGPTSDSPYPLQDHNLGGTSPPTVGPPTDPKGGGGLPMVSYISLTAACKQVISCLKKERDWKILELVLLQLPLVMENKALILSKHGNDVDVLATQLCSMVTDKTLFSSGDSVPFRNTPARFSRSDFQAHVFPALTSLVSYHSSLDTKIQQQIVKCLEHGLVSKSSRICISALTTCTLEMKEVMHKLIPEILLSLSKISPKMNIAIPVLEFLSTLIHLPRVFHSFVSDQYMSIFAICLPYTNPFKFNHYVVSLAHHVIALWFLKCRLSFRRGFVQYIIKGLESNVWAPYMEASEKLLVNEDSSNRKRSSSLTDQSNRRRERMISGQASVQGLSRQTSYQPVDSVTIQFHQELTETCVDLMARYAFADCSPLPTRFESSGWLTQHGGNSQSWMIDNRIITISTSACSMKEMKDGLCDRCWVVCKNNQNQLSASGQQNGSKRSLLVGQHSYDEQDVRTEASGGLSGAAAIRRSNTISGGQQHPAGGPMRRRHRSAMVQQGQQLQIQTQQQQHHHQDDMLLENKLQLPLSENGSSLLGGVGGGGGGGSSEGNTRNGGRKDGNSVCMCWCQGWAEVMIRRPTGNTSWMMRVQNIVGGAGYTHSEERLVSNLCGLYVQDIVDGAKREIEEGMDADSGKGTSREDLEKGPDDQGPVSSQAGSLEEVSMSTSCSVEMASASTTSASTPDKGQSSPTIGEVEGIGSGGGGKMPVKRCNSSPEMTKGGQDQDVEDSQKGPSYLPSCVPIPEETTRKSESEGEGSSQVPPLAKAESRGKVTSSPPSTPHDMPQTLTPVRRDRMFTISVMTPARKNPNQSAVRRIMSSGSGDMPRSGSAMCHGVGGDPGIRSGISPSFVFLQLCGHGVFGAYGLSNKPLPLPISDQTTTSLKVLDYIPPYETHKIGVLYIGPGQAKIEAEILQNSHGSLRYRDFLQGLGTLIKLSETDPQKTFLGGLDGRGVEDGEFACIWRDDVMQVIFHVATLMPTKLQSDPNCNGKKRHIGNDFVAIVYNNSDEEFDISTIKCQFLYACVIIQPLDHRTNRVFVKSKPTLGESIGNTDVKIVSDQNLPIMARQLALHSNLASVIHKKLSQNMEPYASNWLERLRQIKRLRQRLVPETAQGGAGGGSGSGSSSTGGLSVSAQELSDSLGAALLGGAGGPGQRGDHSGGTAGAGSAANVAGGVQKRNSFVVDDFTDYV